MSAPDQSGAAPAVLALTQAQVEALIAAAVAKAIAAQAPLQPVTARTAADGATLTACSIVQPVKGHPRELEAGRVEKVNQDGSVVVKMDVDGALVEFQASELRVLLAH